MENCLVKKLKGEVDNNSLPVFGKVKLRISRINNENPLSPAMMFRPSDTSQRFDMEIIGDATFTNNTKESVAFQGVNQLVNIDNDKVAYCLLSPKNSVKGIRVFKVDNSTDNAYKFRFDDFKYCQNLDYVQIADDLADNVELKPFDSAMFPSLTTIKLTNCRGFTGNLSVFDTLTQLTLFELTQNIGLIGDIADSLPHLINLQTVNITNPVTTGDLKIWFDRLYANGKTSGTLKVWTNAQYSKVVYDGAKFNKRVWNVTFTNSGHTETNDDA